MVDLDQHVDKCIYFHGKYVQTVKIKNIDMFTLNTIKRICRERSKCLYEYDA